MGRIRALLVLCTVGSLGLVAGPALAKPKLSSLPVTRGSQYLALGDSVTFGYMESGVTPTPNYNDPSSFLGYPEQLASALHLSVANAACPGETSSSLIDANGPSLACENNPQGTNAHYRFNYPLHVNYKGSQLAYALSYLHSHRHVRLISLMIGANDFFRCEETTTDACASPSEFSATAATLTKNVHTILSAIRNRAHYRDQIVVLNYYSLDYTSTTGIAQSRALNAAEDAGAKPFHVEIADGYGTFEAASAHSGGNPCTAGLITQLGGGKCGIHPSYAGQALLAQAVEKAIKLG
jgi:lysophospholipase L1-like esterase